MKQRKNLGSLSMQQKAGAQIRRAFLLEETSPTDASFQSNLLPFCTSADPLSLKMTPLNCVQHSLGLLSCYKRIPEAVNLQRKEIFSFHSFLSQSGKSKIKLLEMMSSFCTFLMMGRGLVAGADPVLTKRVSLSHPLHSRRIHDPNISQQCCLGLSFPMHEIQGTPADLISH